MALGTGSAGDGQGSARDRQPSACRVLLLEQRLEQAAVTKPGQCCRSRAQTLQRLFRRPLRF